MLEQQMAASQGQSQGDATKVRMLLAEAYDWFTKGFDTVDFREARALLNTLAGSDNVM
jgi:hypothetical protein